MAEADLMRKIQTAVSMLGARVFRNNVAEAWAGQFILKATDARVVTLLPGDVVLRNARPLHAGLCNDSADLIGWGKRGKFLSIEVKTPTGRMTPGQVNWMSAVNSAGGIGIMVDSESRLIQTLKERDL